MGANGGLNRSAVAAPSVPGICIVRQGGNGVQESRITVMFKPFAGNIAGGVWGCRVERAVAEQHHHSVHGNYLIISVLHISAVWQ